MKQFGGTVVSVGEVEKSDNEDESYKQNNANLDTVLDFVP